MQTFFELILNAILAIILPIQIYLLLVGGFIALSTFLGILAAKKEKEKIELGKLTSGLVRKMFIYTPTTIAIYWLDTILLGDILMQFIPVQNFITKVGTMIILGNEFVSINKNFAILTGKSISDRAKIGIKNILSLKKQYNEFNNDSNDVPNDSLNA